MSSRGPHYINAQPHADYIDHWPTPAEMDALHAAKRQADANFARGHRGTANAGRALISGGNGARATVWRDAPQSYAAWIEAPNPATATGWMSIKGWWGVPEWPAAQSQHSPGMRAAISAPPPQVHHVPEDIHIVRQPRIHHHWQEPEHIHHGAPPRPAIALGAADVSVVRPEVARHHHHESKRGFWGTVFLGPQKREQDRGALQTVEPIRAAVGRDGAPLSLPAPGRPQVAAGSAAPRQLTHQPEPQLPAPTPRKRGLFSWR